MEPEKRLLRVTWNENSWELPSGHNWSKEKQGDSNTAHENQYGFGGEEWLFNTRYNIKGFQYGYIKGLSEISNLDKINIAYLFTINPETKDRLLIGKLKNIEILNDISSLASKTYDSFKGEMVDELKEVNADASKFKVHEFYPVVRFKMKDAEIFNVPRIINELKKGNKYNRFKPYIVDEKLQEIIDEIMVSVPFVFIPGKRRNDNSEHLRKFSRRTANVKGLHSKIVNELEKYLKPEFSINLNNISIEKTLFGENIADVVTLNNDKSLSIYEVKTSYNTRYNIRDAIGQLIDYALWHQDIKIKEIIIVAPSLINEEHSEYVRRIKAHIKLTIKFLKYQADLEEKFIEIK
jgi:hypothetical protein